MNYSPFNIVLQNVISSLRGKQIFFPFHLARGLEMNRVHALLDILKAPNALIK